MASGSQSDSGVGGIVDGVETLTISNDQQVPLTNQGKRSGLGLDDVQECKSVDKVQALTAGASEVTDDEVDLTRLTAYLRVECTWPNLGVWRQLESSL